jgi:hypothetical protein
MLSNSTMGTDQTRSSPTKVVCTAFSHWPMRQAAAALMA